MNNDDIENRLKKIESKGYDGYNPFSISKKSGLWLISTIRKQLAEIKKLKGDTELPACGKPIVVEPIPPMDIKSIARVKKIYAKSKTKEKI